MADKVGKFNGIAVYHNGMMVSDYVNMIPRGETCTDRQGETVVNATMWTQKYDVRGHFMDSNGNVYLVIRNYVHRFTYNEQAKWPTPVLCRASSERTMRSRSNSL